MITADYHVHTTFCDGSDTPETMVLSAIGMGMTRLGFSAHSLVPGYDMYGLAWSKTAAYRDEIRRLRDKYCDRIEILCGLEQDYQAPPPDGEYDYLIGSVHHLRRGGDYPVLDGGANILEYICKELFGGDYYALCEEYYELEADVIRKTGADIIGHFDLITKYNEGGVMFDEKNERYVRAYRAAVDALIPHNVPFEINTGGISRGYRSVPYPSKDIIDYIISKGGSFIMSGDSHRHDTLMYRFPDFEPLAQGRLVDLF